MRAPDEVAAMLRLRALGWGTRRIAAELGCDRETVRRYLAAGGWAPYRAPARPGALAGHGAWLAERFRRHRGNADVVRQELAAELGITVSLRTVERAVAPPAARARGGGAGDGALRDAAGQADADRLRRVRGDDRRRAGPGPPVRRHARATRVGSTSAPSGTSGSRPGSRASRARSVHFGGLPAELLLDNARALVERHDAGTREVAFNARFHAFARYWGVRPVACAPYRARTKGKDERGVGYVKRNAIAGRSFPSWAALEAHLARWTREVADVARPRHDGRAAGRALRARRGGGAAAAGRSAAVPAGARAGPARAERRLRGRRHQPLQRAVALIGAPVSVVVSGGEVRVHHAGVEVARHGERRGRRERAVDRAHLRGIVVATASRQGRERPVPPGADLLRPLAEYERAAGGAW